MEGLIAAENKVVNPHWHDNRCESCHVSNILEGEDQSALKETDPRKLCESCHNNTDRHDLQHASGVKLSVEMQKQLSESFRNALDNGVATCINCHDVPAQCLSERRHEQRRNPKFLRDGPYLSRTDICYQCHNKTTYTRLNPHDQITEDKKLRKETCGLCHDDSKGLSEAKNIDEVGFNIKGDLSKMCNGCHPWKPHPGGNFLFNRNRQVEHLVVPSDVMQEHMKLMEKQNGIILPLDPNTGKVFCATCHNPHEEGVVKSVAANKGADSSRRLRAKEICNNCHEK
ncbi:MAG: hypothetical protein OQK73_13390 [Gammaproteobacteria bacterium]|nr:hypothetical protein [Gammaproteobacteria bacterium]